ncbi:Ras GTPase activating protein ira2 [Microbotryomycetes sp. JL221]|nr:Ras GTPase activating protein ira2 [Microbotryomycetes sp. JL221]
MSDAPPNKLKKSLFSRARPDWSRKSLSGDDGAHQPAIGGTSKNSFDNSSREQLLALQRHNDDLSHERLNASLPPLLPPLVQNAATGASLNNNPARQRSASGSVAFSDARERTNRTMPFNSSTAAVEAIVRQWCLQLPHLASSSQDSSSAAQGPFPANQTAEDTLLRIAKLEVGSVVQPLLAELEAISKPIDAAGFTSLDILRSQASLLSCIAACLMQSWAHEVYRDQGSNSAPYTTATSTDVSSPSPLPDQPAAQLWSLVSVLWKQNASHTSLTSLQEHDNIQIKSSADVLPTNASRFCQQVLTATLRSERANSTAHWHTTKLLHTGSGSSKLNRTQAKESIVQSLALIAYSLSASNWTMIHSWLVGKLGAMTKKEGNSDVSEVQLLECCNLNRIRLSMVIQDLCATYTAIRKPYQRWVSTSLGAAIFAYIDAFPIDFSSLHREQRRVEGGPDVLFDAMTTLSEKNKDTRSSFWPTLTMLLVCCPDLITKLIGGIDLKNAAKKAHFLSILRAALTEGEDPASVDAVKCAQAIIFAAARTEPDERNPCALRVLAGDLQDDLINRIFSPTSGALLLHESAHARLVTQSIVELYRFDSSKAIETIFRVHVQPKADAGALAVVLDATRVLLREDLDESRPAWTPSPTALIPALSRALRELFANACSRTSATPVSDVRPSPVRQAQLRDQNDDSISRDELIIAIADIWINNQKFLTHGLFVPPVDAPANQPGGDDTLSRIALVATKLLNRSHHPSVRRCIATLLLKVYRTRTATPIHALDKHLSTLLATSALCAYAIESWHFPGEEQTAYALLLEDLRQHQVVIQSLPANIIVALVMSAQIGSTYNLLQIALLLGLPSATNTTSNDTSVIESLKLMPLIANYIESIVKTLTTSATPPGLPPSLTFLRMLGSSTSTSPQEHLASTNLSSATSPTLADAAKASPTTGTLIAWNEAVNRLEDCSKSLTRLATTHDGVERDTHEANRLEWTRLAELALRLVDGITSGRASSLVTGAHSDSLPPRLRETVDVAAQIEKLMRMFANALTDLDETTRTAAGTIFAQHSRPSDLPTLVSHCSLFNDQNHRSIKEDVFSQTAVGLLDVITSSVKRMLAAGFLDSTGFDGVWSFGLECIQRVGIVDGHSAKGLSLYIRACQVVVALAIAEIPPPKQVGEQLLDALFSQARAIQMAQHIALGSVLCKAVSVLLKVGIPFEHSTEHRFGVELRRQIEAVDETMAVETDVDAATSLAEMGRALVQGLSFLLGRTSSAVPKVVAQLSESQELEAAERRVHLLPTEHDLHEARMNVVKLVQTSPALVLAMSRVVPASSCDALIETLIQTLGTRQAMSSFVMRIVQEEVDATEHEATLFRGNSFATRLLTVYARAKGYHYLRNTLEQLITTLCQRSSGLTALSRGDTFDLESRRASEEDDFASQDLEQVIEAFLSALSNSIADMPPEVRDICLHVAEAVGTKFPESVFTSIGGFIFLRFINPAIISPETIDLTLSISSDAHAREVRKSLVMITKVLQSLSNNVRFGIKDPSMRKLNAFMDVQVFTIANFLQRISQPCPLNAELGTWTECDVAGDAVEFMCDFLVRHDEKLYAELQAMAHADSAVPGRILRMADKLNTRLAIFLQHQQVLGFDAGHRSATTSDALEAFVDKVETHGRASATEWQHAFYETAASKVGTPTWCLALNQIEPLEDDLDSLAAVVLSTLALMEAPYDLLVDATGFSPEQTIDTHRIVYWLSLVRASSLEMVSRVIVLSPSTAFQALVARVDRHFGSENVFSRKVHCEVDWSQLESQYYNLDVVLPSQSVELYRERRSRITASGDVFEVSEAKADVPVSVSVGTSSIMVQWQRPVALLGDAFTTLVDFVHLGDLEDVRQQTQGNMTLLSWRSRRNLERRTLRFMSLQSSARTAEALALAKPVARPRSLLTSVAGRAESSTVRMIVLCLRGLGSTHSDSRKFAQGLLDELLQMQLDSGTDDQRLWSLVLEQVKDFALHVWPSKRANEAAVASLLAMNAASVFRVKLLAQVRQLIAKIAVTSPEKILSKTSQWVEISGLLELDSGLSFESNPQIFLPELLYIVSTVVGCGDWHTRNVIRATLLNAVHALRHLGTPWNPEQLEQIWLNLSRADKLFRLSASPSVAMPAWDLLIEGASLCQQLLDILDAAAPNNDTANSWRARWASLVMTACFQHSPAVQERQFLTLSLLGASAIDGDLVYQVLTSLRLSLRMDEIVATEQPARLVLVILRTLVTTLPALVDETPLWTPLAWVCSSFLQVGWLRLDAAAVPLLTVILESMDVNHYFENQTPEDALNEWRNSFGPREVLQQLDESCGVSFRSSFGFALAHLLSTPLLERATRAATVSLLFQLLRLTRDTKNTWISSTMLPFFLLLIGRCAADDGLLTLANAVGIKKEIDDPTGTSLVEAMALNLGPLGEDQVTLAIGFILSQTRHDECPQERIVWLCLLRQLAKRYHDTAAGL